MQDGFSWFLEHLGYLKRVVKSKLPQKLFFQVFFGPVLKSPMMTLFSYFDQLTFVTRLQFKFSEWAFCSYLDYKNTH